MFMISLYTSNFCGCAARSEGNTKTAKLIFFMFSLIELGLGLNSRKTLACFKSSDLLGPVISWTSSN